MEKSRSPEDDVKIPLNDKDPTPSQPPPSQPQAVPDTDSAKKPNSFCLCFRTFIDSTTIRGVKHCIHSPHLILRLFWILFITLSFALVFTVGSFCIISYMKFQTVVRQHKTPVAGGDFPVITMCSDGFFGDTEDIRKLIDHPEAYDRLLMKKIKEAMNAKDYGRPKKLLKLRSILNYNVNNVKVLQEMIEDELQRKFYKILNSFTRAIAPFECSIDTDSQCSTVPFFNFKYRNCISARVPANKAKEKIRRMTISGVLMSDKSPPAMLPDQDQASSIYPSGQHIHVFLHEPGTLPHDLPDFVISVNSDQWILIDFDVTHLRRIITPRFKCATDPMPNTTHAQEKIRLNPALCQQILKRMAVRKKCGCELPKFPFDNWPLKEAHFCGEFARNGLKNAIKEIQCAEQVLFEEKFTGGPKCYQPCSERMYHARLFVNDMDRSAVNRIKREKYIWSTSNNLYRRCNPRKRGRKWGKKQCLGLFNAFQIIANDSSINIDKHRQLIGHGKSRKKKSESYWTEAFPKITNSAASNETKLVTNSFSITVRCPKMQVDAEDESLVRTIWTTLAQVGGASAFLAGFSFGVIAEIIDTFYKFFKRKHGSK